MTAQQALKEAIDSGAVQAWIDGKIAQWSHRGGDVWRDYLGGTFSDPDLKWRPKPEPVHGWAALEAKDKEIAALKDEVELKHAALMGGSKQAVDQLAAKDAEITALMEKGVAKDFEIHSKDAEIERLKFELLDGDRFDRLQDQLAEARRLLEPMAELLDRPTIPECGWPWDIPEDICEAARTLLQNSEAAK